MASSHHQAESRREIRAHMEKPASVDLETSIRGVREELARISHACLQASERGRPGNLFYLLRKKWQLMQELFEAENQRRLHR